LAFQKCRDHEAVSQFLIVDHWPFSVLLLCLICAIALMLATAEVTPTLALVREELLDGEEVSLEWRGRETAR
jgi:hypothetical protein